MTLQRELMTIPVGQSVSNGINLGTEKLAGIRLIEVSNVTALRVQGLVGGNLGDAASEVWVDLFATSTDNPPNTDAGYDAGLIALLTGTITNGFTLLFPVANVGHVPPVIRLAAGANVAGTPFTARIFTNPHA